MNASSETTRARRYLLGEADEHERAVIEQEYFVDARALERMEAAEEALIEDYLSNRLGSAERSRFERDYLTVPHHRTRVDTIRALMANDPRASTPRKAAPLWMLRPFALAAAALLAVAVAAWWLRPSPNRQESAVQRQQAATPEQPKQPESTPLASPRVMAITISPVAVRSAGDSASLVIPPGTDLVRLQLEGDPQDKSLVNARALVRTVTGDEVWRGPAAISAGGPPGTVARIDVPAAQLRPDDYVVELFGRNPAGVEQERYRYFVRVRAL
jgi:hypothetical protein